MRTLAFVALLTLFAGAASGQQITSTTGTTSEGQVLTIYGSGFGDKSPAPPLLWDNFNTGANGTPIGDPVIGSYARTSPSVYSNTTPYAGARCLSSTTTSGNPFAGVITRLGNGVQNAFASMKFRFVGAGTIPSNIKLFRFNTAYPEGDWTHGEPNSNIGKEYGESQWFYNINNQANPITCPPGQYSGARPPWTAGLGEASSPWIGMSMWDHMSTAGVADGFVGQSTNGAVAEYRNVVTRLPCAIFAGPRYALFSEYFSAGIATVYIDNVYADSFLARVEIGNAPTYGGVGSTNLEIQPPLTWSDTQITITVNQGTLVALSTAYIYVTTSAGVTSDGYAITMGTPTTSEEITPPSNLRVRE